MKILLIDGNNISYMGQGRVMTHEEVRTETIFTGMNMVRGYLDEFRPDRVAVVWDGGRDKRRMELYPEYKKRKEKTESEKIEAEILYKQMALLKECLRLLGITQFKVPYREADDVIYNIIKMFLSVRDITEIIVVTTDKDYYQLFLLNDSLKVFNPVKKQLWDKDKFQEEFGFHVCNYLTYKAVVGDPSDNLPGLKGIGPVGAKTIIESLYRFADDSVLTKKEYALLEKFANNEEVFELMKKLMRFMDINKQDILDVKEKHELKSVNELYTTAVEIMNKYGFERMLNNFAYFIEPFEALLLKEHNHKKLIEELEDNEKN